MVMQNISLKILLFSAFSAVSSCGDAPDLGRTDIRIGQDGNIRGRTTINSCGDQRMRTTIAIGGFRINTKTGPC